MNVMIDLETLDTAPSTVILSVGLVAFDKEKIVDRFYAVPSAKEQLKLGRSVSVSTISWWINQNANAKKVFKEQEGPESFYGVMGEVNAFLNKYPDAKIWSHGANFDVPIVQHAFEMLNIGIPWKYGNVRCFRTWCDDKKAPYRSKFATHNALKDAEDQAQHMIDTNRFAEYGSNQSVLAKSVVLTEKELEEAALLANRSGAV